MSLQKPFGTVPAFFRSSHGAALVLFLLALVLRLVHLYTNSFDGLYGQDAYAYYNYARELYDALTQLNSPTPFWWPLGYPALLSISFLIGGVSIASAQTITIVCGALAAPLAFALAVESAPSEHALVAGWVAGLLVTVGGQLVQSSVVIMADAPALMWATLGAWLLLRYARTVKLLELCLAAFAVGMAVWARWQYCIFAGVWVLTLAAIRYKISVTPRTKNAPGISSQWLPLVYACAIIGLVLFPQILMRSGTAVPLAGSSWLEGWSPANFFGRSFDTVDGHFEYALPVALFYGQVLAHPAYLVALLTPLLVIGSISTVRRFLIAPHIAILLFGWSGGMYLFLAGIPYENFRFSLGLIVPLCVITGLGAQWLWRKWQASQLRWVLVAWIGVALLVMLWWQPRVLEPVLAIKARENSQIQALAAQVPDGAVVWTLGFSGQLETYTKLRSRELWHVTPEEIRRTAPAYLLIDVQTIETQWRDREPNALYQSLLASGSLETIGQLQNLTLYRIK